MQPQHIARGKVKRRETPRVSASIEVQAVSGGRGKYEGMFTRQIGKNGCLVLGLENAVIGETVNLILKIDDRNVKISGKIVYRLNDFDGFCAGVKFTRISQSDKEYLSAFVDRCILKKAKITKRLSPTGDITLIQISGSPHAIEISTIIKGVTAKEDIGRVLVDFRKADLEYLWLDDLATISSAMKEVRTEGLGGKIAIIMNRGTAFNTCEKYFRGGGFENPQVKHRIFADLLSGLQWLENGKAATEV